MPFPRRYISQLLTSLGYDHRVATQLYEIIFSRPRQSPRNASISFTLDYIVGGMSMLLGATCKGKSTLDIDVEQDLTLFFDWLTKLYTSAASGPASLTEIPCTHDQPFSGQIPPFDDAKEGSFLEDSTTGVRMPCLLSAELPCSSRSCQCARLWGPLRFGRMALGNRCTPLVSWERS